MRHLLFIVLLLCLASSTWGASSSFSCGPETQTLSYDARNGNPGLWTYSSGGISCGFSVNGTINALYLYHNDGGGCALTLGPQSDSPAFGQGFNVMDYGGWVSWSSSGLSASLYPQPQPGSLCSIVVWGPWVVVDYTPYNAWPVTVSASGLSGNFNIGTEKTVTATVRDADGYANISYFRVLLTSGVDGTNACWLEVRPNANTVALANDSGTFGTAYTFGTANTPANSSCRVNVQTSSRSISGTDATATLKITFLPLVFNRGGARPPATTNTYLNVWDMSAATSGWSAAYQTATARTGPKLIVRSTH